MLTKQQEENHEIFKQIMELIEKLNIERKANPEKTNDAIFFIGVQQHKDGDQEKINVTTSFSGSEAGLADGFNEIVDMQEDNPIAGPILNAASNLLANSGYPHLIPISEIVADYCQQVYNGIECDCAECRAEREK